MQDVPELTSTQAQSLNEEFYEMEPWMYYQQRLAHLMLAAIDK